MECVIDCLGRELVLIYRFEPQTLSNVDPFILRLFAALAEKERALISPRTATVQANAGRYAGRVSAQLTS